MSKHGAHDKKTQTPTAPSKDDMLRYQAESVVRDAIGKTPIFEQEVKRVMQTLKTMEKDTVKRITKGRTERPA